MKFQYIVTNGIDLTHYQMHAYILSKYSTFTTFCMQMYHFVQFEPNNHSEMGSVDFDELQTRNKIKVWGENASLISM